MPLGLGQISNFLSGGNNQISGTHEHPRELNQWGNSMGLMPDVPTPEAKYQQLLAQFENRYAAIIEPPANLDPDLITELEFQAEESSTQLALRQEFRKHQKSMLGDEVSEYKGVISAQADIEGKARDIQTTNTGYLKQNIQGQFTAAKTEAKFGGWMSAMRQSANRSQSYVRYD